MDGNGSMRVRKYRALFVFCGIGGGALGFKKARAEFRRLGISAQFEIVGGIEIDESTARDFERLTGAPCLVMDVRHVTPELLRELFGDEIDLIFFSPPCKQACGLLSKEIAFSPKYVEMGALGIVWCKVMFEAWPRGPRLLLMENVPRIRTRAPQVMEEIRATLREHGYLIHESAHDCGELGGLAQHRERLLLVGRRRDVGALLYQPIKKRVRSVGEVLGALPLPGDPAAGPMHRLPKIEAITALRLALIPAGGDWRNLPDRVLLPPDLARAVAKGRRRKSPSERTPFNDVWRVVNFDESAPCVTTGGTPSAGGLSVADPRGARAGADTRNDDHGVTSWDSPSGTITGQTRPSNGRFSVADPRPLKGSHPHTFGVIRWTDPSHTITGNTVPGGGPFSVADPRITCKTRENSGIYGVIPFDRPSGTIVAHACHDNGRFSVADPRWPSTVPFPVILSTDGTWHRPLTTLECAVLQGFDPFNTDGQPFVLDGSKDDQREKVGDAVPVTSAEAIGTQVLLTLVHADEGIFALSSGGAVWVRQRGAQRELVIEGTALQ